MKMKKIAIVLPVLLAFCLISCSEDYLDVNTDPNNPAEITPALALAPALTFTSHLLYDSGGNSGVSRKTNTLGNLFMYNWSQSDGYSWYVTEFQYLVTNTFYSSIWTYSYQRALIQYELLQNLGANAGNYKAISSIMQAFHFQILVDAYGDIPYAQALERRDFPTPEFDKAEAVYDSLIVDLSDAIATIELAAENPDALVPGEDDILFEGDMLRWKKLANTLKMRILVRQSGMSSKQAYIQEQFNVIANSGYGFITEDAIINPGYVNEEGKQSPFWQSFGTTVTGDAQNNYKATSATDFVIQLLQNTNDTRIGRIYEAPDSGFRGIPQGIVLYPVDNSYLPENVSNMGPGLLKGAEMGSPVFLATQSYFLQAEAALDGYISGSPQALYEAGITASYTYLGVGADQEPAGDPAVAAATYYSQNMPNVGWAASPNKLEAIITQKWIALNGINGFESWVEYNRTGFPQSLPLSLQALKNSRPVRLLYPASASSANGNVPPQNNDLAFTNKIFWAK